MSEPTRYCPHCGGTGINCDYLNSRQPEAPVSSEVPIPAVEELVSVLGDIVDETPCRFDHHGGCQEHGYLSLENGEECPQGRAQRLIHRHHNEK